MSPLSAKALAVVFAAAAVVVSAQTPVPPHGQCYVDLREAPGLLPLHSDPCNTSPVYTEMSMGQLVIFLNFGQLHPGCGGANTYLYVERYVNLVNGSAYTVDGYADTRYLLCNPSINPDSNMVQGDLPQLQV